MPEKVTTARSPSDGGPAVQFRRPSDELVQRAARRAVQGQRASFPSQSAFLGALLEIVRREEPLAAVGGARLRRLVVGSPGVRLSVQYRELAEGPAPASCPVCGGELVNIRNRTLTGEQVVLGRRCTRCDYWTHGRRRVPVRYVFSKAGRPSRAGKS